MLLKLFDLSRFGILSQRQPQDCRRNELPQWAIAILEVTWRLVTLLDSKVLSPLGLSVASQDHIALLCLCSYEHLLQCMSNDTTICPDCWKKHCPPVGCLYFFIVALLKVWSSHSSNTSHPRFRMSTQYSPLLSFFSKTACLNNSYKTSDISVIWFVFAQ